MPSKCIALVFNNKVITIKIAYGKKIKNGVQVTEFKYSPISTYPELRKIRMAKVTECSSGCC